VTGPTAPTGTALAVDLGGSSLKACLFGLDGESLAQTAVSLAFEEDATGRSEIDPVTLWAALTQAVETLRVDAGGALDAVAAVAICGFTRSQVLLGADGAPVSPVVGFRDSRAAAEAEAARRAAPDHPEARHLNAFHPLARLLWLQRHRPAAWAATRSVLEPKDYLNWCLTGHAASDPISQHRLAAALAGGPSSLAARAGLRGDPLPVHQAPQAVVGTVVPGLPGALSRLAGARVVSGSLDTWAAVAALGALAPGRAYGIAGTSEVVGLVSDRVAEAEGLLTVPWGEGLWQLGGPSQNGANVLAWIADLLAPGDGPLSERVEGLLEEPVSRRPVVFLPFLQGERTPFWDVDLRAAFVGLSAEHGRGDLVRAVLAGLACLNRLVLERAEAAAGISADAVRIGGGGARSGAWNQIRANVLGRPVLASHTAEMGLVGCLALARFALGLDGDLARAAEAVGAGFHRFEPDPDGRSRADALYTAFVESAAVLPGPLHTLARAVRP